MTSVTVDKSKLKVMDMVLATAMTNVYTTLLPKSPGLRSKPDISPTPTKPTNPQL